MKGSKVALFATLAVVAVVAAGMYAAEEEVPTPEPTPVIVDTSQEDLIQSLKAEVSDLMRERAELKDQLNQRRPTADMELFLTALRAEADLLMEVAENHTANRGSLSAERKNTIGYALSRIHNRVVNDCEYVAYKHAEESDGEVWNLRRVDLACTD